MKGEPHLDDADEPLAAVVHKLLHKDPTQRLRSALALSKRRFFDALDFELLDRKQTTPPFRPVPTAFAGDEDVALNDTFGDQDDTYTNPDEPGEERPSLTFRGGEHFKGFSVFASPRRPAAKKHATTKTPQVLPPRRTR